MSEYPTGREIKSPLDYVHMCRLTPAEVEQVIEYAETQKLTPFEVTQLSDALLRSMTRAGWSKEKQLAMLHTLLAGIDTDGAFDLDALIRKVGLG